ncbi:MAG: tRNA (adenosine(37)-N6)-dimethylallyltransferase MiaA [Saprospiraceae bacterium]|nr:tRNA (adenosine(37)-N6)-dimethylallyltransferase MiaA [Saprospiraceae bacterium]
MNSVFNTKNKYLIVIAGPTAIGKTNMALEVADYFKGEIFSADSRQLYREMNIGTAKPSEDILKKVKHHFINHISINEPYSVGKYEAEIHSELENYFKTQNFAVLTGGTGLYIRSVLEGLDTFPDVDEKIMISLNQRLLEEGLTTLSEELAEKDPVYFAKVDTQNPRRIIRALSVIQANGTPYSEYLKTTPERKKSFIPIEILLELPRETLYSRINERVDIMISEGLVDEARSLFSLRHLSALQTVGYQELFEYFEGTLTLESAIELIKRNSRRYAKRQITWFGKYGNWTNFDPAQKVAVINFIKTVAEKSEHEF